jgi:thiosulfate dehydrogenase [quinone] large subunit
MTRKIERPFLFVFRMIAGTLFVHASLGDQIFKPNFVETHFIPVTNQAGLFHPFFSILADPALAQIIGPLVPYGHLFIGLSLLSGLMVRVSASIGFVVMMLYLLVGMQAPDLNVLVNHSAVVILIVQAYRIAMYAGDIIGDQHTIYCVILAYLIVGQAGYVWGLDAWVGPFLRSHWLGNKSAHLHPGLGVDGELPAKVARQR